MLSNHQLVKGHLNQVQNLERCLDAVGYLPILGTYSGLARVALGVGQLAVCFFKALEIAFTIYKNKQVHNINYFFQAFTKSDEGTLAICILKHAGANIARGFITAAGLFGRVVVFAYDLGVQKIATYDVNSSDERWLDTFTAVKDFRFDVADELSPYTEQYCDLPFLQAKDHLRGLFAFPIEQQLSSDFIGTVYRGAAVLGSQVSTFLKSN